MKGEACTPSAASQETADAWRVGNYLVIQSESDTNLLVAGPEEGSTECAELSHETSLKVLDVALNRGVELFGLGTDVSIDLHPAEHAVTAHGRFCEKRIEISQVH